MDFNLHKLACIMFPLCSLIFILLLVYIFKNGDSVYFGCIKSGNLTVCT